MKIEILRTTESPVIRGIAASYLRQLGRTVLPALALLAAAATAIASPPEVSAQTLSQPVSNDEAEFHISINPGPLELNPLRSYVLTESQIHTGLHEGLVSYHPMTLQPVPAIARDWEISNDETKIRFDLRPRARFSDGQQITAHDVRDTWLTLLSLGDDAPYGYLYDVIEGAQEFRSGETDDRDTVGITAEGDHELIVELRKPAPHFISTLPHHSFTVLHPDVLDQEDWSGLEDFPTSGPFVLARNSSDRLVLEKDDEYWGSHRLGLDRVIFDRTMSPSEATNAILDRQLEWVAGGIAFDDLTDDTLLTANSLFGTAYFFFRVAEEPWDDSRVRTALAFLLPWEQIRNERTVFAPTEHLVPSLANYPSPDGISERDIEEALELLADAGYPDGSGLPDPLIRVPPAGNEARVAELMKETWEEHLELDVEIDHVPYPDYFEATGDPEVTLGSMNWIGDYVDPLALLQLWRSDSALNEAGYDSPDFDALLEEGMTKDGSERYELLSQAEEILLQDAVVLPVTHLPAFSLVDHARIDGWYPNVLDIHPLRYLQFLEPEPFGDFVKAGSPTPQLIRTPALP